MKISVGNVPDPTTRLPVPDPHTCIVALDDVDHIKHAKSVADALNDPRFTLIFRTHEKFGAAIFTFNPHVASSRVAA